MTHATAGCLGALRHACYVLVMRPEGEPVSTRPDAPPGLFLARDGTWYHDGQAIHHERLGALLHRSITRGDDGTLIVTTGRDVLPFVAEDAPFVVRHVHVGDARAVLSDGTEEQLVGPLHVDDDGRVRVRVKGGRFWALLSRTAAQVVMSGVDDDGARVHLAARTFEIADGTHDWRA